MKKAGGFFKDVPINLIIAAALALFVMQAAVIMYYNENNLAFTSADAYHSLSKASSMAESGFAKVDKTVPLKKEANGFLYPVLTALLQLITGKFGLIPVLYVLAFAMMLFILTAYYKTSMIINTGYSPLVGLIFFATLWPAALSVFSGGDVALVFLLFGINVWSAVYGAEKGRYAGVFVTAALLALCGYTGLVFAMPSLAYVFLKMNQKGVRKNYALLTAGALIAAVVAAKLIMAFVFIKKLDMEFLQQSGIFDTKTFLVDTFFKDGFLWSKVVPPFIGIFFFFALITDAIAEVKAKKTTHITFFVFVTCTAVVMEMFAAFSKDADTLMFMSPFYFVMALYAFRGMALFAALFRQKTESRMNPSNILYGLLIFVIFYNSIALFTKTFERANKLRYMSGNAHYEKFIER